MQKFTFAQRIVIALVVILTSYQLFNVSASHDAVLKYAPMWQNFKDSYFSKKVSETKQDLKVESKPDYEQID